MLKPKVLQTSIAIIFLWSLAGLADPKNKGNPAKSADCPECGLASKPIPVDKKKIENEISIDAAKFKNAIQTFNNFASEENLPPCPKGYSIFTDENNIRIYKSCERRDKFPFLQEWLFKWSKPGMQLLSFSTGDSSYFSINQVLNSIEGIKKPPDWFSYEVSSTAKNMVSLTGYSGDLLIDLNIEFDREGNPRMVSKSIGHTLLSNSYLTEKPGLQLQDLSIPDAFVCGWKNVLFIRIEKGKKLGEADVNVISEELGNQDGHAKTIAHIPIEEDDKTFDENLKDILFHLDKTITPYIKTPNDQVLWVARECLRLRMNFLDANFPQSEIKENEERVFSSLKEIDFNSILEVRKKNNEKRFENRNLFKKKGSAAKKI
jgi:hypothetical protein